jgi:hypothetical protein
VKEGFLIKLNASKLKDKSSRSNAGNIQFYALALYGSMIFGPKTHLIKTKCKAM